MSDGRTFRMGTLDHVHIRVPDRAAAAEWYREHLGFELYLGREQGGRAGSIT